MRLFCTVILWLAAAIATAAPPVQVENLRMWPAPERTRLVFDTSAPVNHSIFTLGNPNRVVIDFKRARLVRPMAQPKQKDRLLKRVRSAVRSNGDLRVVLDLKDKVGPKSFKLKPDRNYGHRLVVDLFLEQGKAARSAKVKRRAVAPRPTLRDVVIALDAGHGGEDPGATGKYGTKEKDVAMSIARELQRLIAKERGMRAVMIRDGDYQLRLRKRIGLARKHKADFFISIHADAFNDPRVKGASVYTLSQNGATSEAARWLAEQENSADLIGGVSLDDKDELLASVLLDLSQTATIEASIGAGTEVLKGLKKIGKVHKRRIQQAGFAVLKSPDIPSILVETAFISNPEEEMRLRKRFHQRKMAKAIVDGLRRYFADNAPPDTLLAARKHVITRGDTLSGLAQKYNISQESLRASNDLRDSRLMVGKVLRIPVL